MARPLRGTIVWPLSATQAVVLADGVVAPDHPTPRPAGPGDPEREDGLIIPAFADWHFHWVQLGIAGRATRQLLGWLTNTAWPEEERFADPGVCTAEAPGAVERLRSVGTLAGAGYGSPNAAS